MQLNNLPKTKKTSKKRLGRGYGSGKGGHTSGRGAKGAKARGKIPLAFTGTKMRKSFLKKLPLQRGKGRFKPLSTGPIVVNLKYLNLFQKGEVVDLKSLVIKRLISEKEAVRYGVKILGDGQLEVGLKVAVPLSRSAAKKVIQAGGEVVAAGAVTAASLSGSKTSVAPAGSPAGRPKTAKVPPTKKSGSVRPTPSLPQATKSQSKKVK